MPKKFAWLCSHESYQPEVLVDQAVAAEQAGFDAVLGSDHFHPWVDDESAAGFVWTWLGAVAARTEWVELATSVTCPLFHYHPGLIAQAAATTDRLSGGRFILGVGTGENLNEGPLGFPFPGYTERIARMKEALEIMHRLLAGEKLDYKGEYYTTDKARLYSPPVRPVPIWMAAGGPKSAAFAGAASGQGRIDLVVPHAGYGHVRVARDPDDAPGTLTVQANDMDAVATAPVLVLPRAGVGTDDGDVTREVAIVAEVELRPVPAHETPSGPVIDGEEEILAHLHCRHVVPAEGAH